MRHRYNLGQQIARTELLLDHQYQRVARDATHLCQQLLGPRCQIPVVWLSALVWTLLALRALARRP
jgi:hypothetical protein